MRRAIWKQSIIASIILVFLFSGVLYAVNVTLVKHYTEGDVLHQVLLRQNMVSQMHELLYQGVEKNLDSILSDSDIYTLADHGQDLKFPLSREDIGRVYDIQQKINDIILNDDNIRSIYVHFLNADYIISSEHFEKRKDEFYDQQWIESSEKIKETGVIPRFLYGNIDYNMGDIKWSYECVRYIFPFRPYLRDEKVIIIINYDTAVLDKLFYAEENYETILLNDNFDVFYSSISNPNIQAIWDSNVETIREASKNEESILLNGEVLATFVKDNYGNTIVNLAEYEKLLSEYDGLLLIIFIFVILITILAAFVWLITNLHIYSPVRQAIQSIYKLSENLKLDGKIDNLTIDKAVSRLVEQVKNSELKRQENKFFDKVLLHKEELIENPYLNKSFFCGIRMLLDDSASFQWENGIEDIVLNVITEIFDQNGIQGIGKVRNQYCFEFLLSFDIAEEYLKTGEPLEKYHLETFQAIQQKVVSILEHTITIGVGEVYNNIKYLPISIEEARHRAERRILLGKNKIICESEETNIFYLPVKETKQIMDAIEKKDNERAQMGLDTLRKQVSDGIISLSTKTISAFVGYLIFEFMQISVQSEDCSKISFNITKLETFDEIIDYLKKEVASLIETRESVQTEEFNVLQKASHYIRNNYQKDIDVNTIAENVGISYSRLRRMILEEFGINIVDYINTLRIEQAKKLLLETTDTVVEIARQVGYNNEQSLTRYFKKIEGSSPGEYRKNNRPKAK